MLRRSIFLRLVLGTLLVIGFMAPAGADPVTIDGRIAHPSGAAIELRTIELRPDAIVLAVVIANPGKREIRLNRAHSFVLQDEAGGIYRLNPPIDNPELRIPAGAQLAADLVFIGPLAPTAHRLVLSTNEGIGTPDNPYDNAPMLRSVLPPLPQQTAAAAVVQANHPNGVIVRLRRLSRTPAGCLLSLRATNGNERTVILNEARSLALLDAHGTAAPVASPADNRELVLPPGSRLDAELACDCRRLAEGELTLAINRGTAGTADNPYDTLPVLALPVHADPASERSAAAASTASVEPIARTQLWATAPAGPAVAAFGAVQPAAIAAPPVSAPPATPAVAAARPALPDTRAPADPAALEAALHATKTARGVRIVLPADALFGAAGDNLGDAADPLLSSVAKLVAALHPREIDVAGHTDSAGNDDDNLALSRKRAHAIADWLAAHAPGGAAHVAETGFGRTRPVAPNHQADGSDNPEGRAKNRRIEIMLRR